MPIVGRVTVSCHGGWTLIGTPLLASVTLGLGVRDSQLAGARLGS